MLYNRKLNRLAGYDYSLPGQYFVTICTQNNVAQSCWWQIPNHFPNIKLDEFIIMPNHIHGILVVGTNNYWSLRRSWRRCPWQTKWGKTISSAIRGFKVGVTKWCRENNHPNFAWQRSFYDHIIRREEALYNIREYIKRNPIVWDSGNRI